MLAKIAANLIGIYQKYLRLIMPSSCRFSPSCSEYAKEAVLRHGFCKGAAKALKRIFCCHPFSKRSGYDPVI